MVPKAMVFNTTEIAVMMKVEKGFRFTLLANVSADEMRQKMAEVQNLASLSGNLQNIEMMSKMRLKPMCIVPDDPVSLEAI